MLIFSIGIFVIGFVVLAGAIRGRVVQHGEFCNRCRFDLAGIDLSDENAKCPECGQDVTNQRATRPNLRQKRPVLLVLGLLLMLTGGSLMGIVASNNTARVLAAMPDPVVFTLHAMGMDAAYTEIATNRLTQSTGLSDETWSKLIRTTLEHQANPEFVWDPRDGEVLMQAFTRARLSPEQIEQYFDLGFEAFAEFPDEIRHGVDEMGVSLAVQPTGRISSLSGTMGVLIDGTDTVWNRLEIYAGGLANPEFETEIQNLVGYAGLHIPGVSGGGRGSIGGKISFEKIDWDTIEPNKEYTFYIKYKTGVIRMSDDHAHQERVGTLEQRVRILPGDAQLIELDTHPDTIASFRDQSTIRITPLHIFPEGDRRQSDRGVHLADCSTITKDMPITVAGNAVLIYEGQEYHMGQVARKALSGHGISGMRWVSKDPIPETLIEAILQAGSVTIEIRPDPSVAEIMPGVKRILGLPIRFEDVIVTNEPWSSSQSSMAHPDQRVGRVVIEPADE